MRFLDSGGCGVGETVLEGFDFEDLAFFGCDGSGAEEVSMDSFLLEAVFDVEGFNIKCLGLCTCVTVDIEGSRLSTIGMRWSS